MEPVLNYSMGFLKKLKQSTPPLSPWFRKILNKEGVAQIPTKKRG